MDENVMKREEMDEVWEQVEVGTESGKARATAAKERRDLDEAEEKEDVDGGHDEEDMDEEEEDEEFEERGPSGISLALNRYFHHLDRGGTLGGEITAGIIMFFLSICVIFMNMQVVANAINGEVTLVSSPANATNIAVSLTYAQIYAGSILVAIVGSLLIGLVAKLPFTQLSLMGLCSSLLCLVGTGAGLTYENLLFVNFIAAVIYTVAAAVPDARAFFYKAMPQAVRKGLPVAVGLIFAYTALKMSGIVSTTEVAVGAGKSQYVTLINGFTAFSSGRKLVVYGFIGAIVAMLLYILLRILKRKHAALLSLLGGTIVFFAVDAVLAGVDTANTDSILNFGRIWMAAGSQASQETPFADSYLTYFGKAIGAIFANLGNVITKGSDFGGYSGNTILLVINGVLGYLFMGMYGAEGIVLAAEDELNADAESAVEGAMTDVAAASGKIDVRSADGMKMAWLCNAVTNVIAPFLGVGAVSFGLPSLAAAKDRGKSGIASIVACVGYVISLFIMAFPVLLATTTYAVGSMNQWNYFAYGNGGFVYLMQEASFAIADVVMVCVGVSTLTNLKKWNWKNVVEWIPALSCAVVAVLFTNVVLGVACGMILYVVLAAVFGKEGRQKVEMENLVLLAVMIVILGMTFGVA